MVINAYEFDLLLEYIEENKEKIEAVLCAGGLIYDNDFHFETVYRKEKGFLKDLTCPKIKLCGEHCFDFDHRRILQAVIINSDNKIDVLAVGKRVELPDEEVSLKNRKYFRFYL